MEFHKTLLCHSPFPLSLYIHIPFCVKKCFYCDFYSIPYDKNKAEYIINELILEIRFFFRTFSHIKIRTIYIGGGTPSCLSLQYLEKLLKEITSLQIHHIKEWTVEANPESVTKEFLLLCKKFYVTRLSIGIQSIENTFLRVLGRHTSFSHIEKVKDLIKQYWNGEVSIDLITGIPGQTYESLEKDILYCVKAFEPEHVSLYSLTIEPGTELDTLIKNKKINLLSQDSRDVLWFKGYGLLESLRFNNYEISNFAKKGKESIHNIQYWNLDPYVGLGPGAISTLPGGNKSVIRISHTKDNKAYLKGKKNTWGMKCEIIDKKTFIFETCMMGLRLKHGIQKIKFDNRFGISLPQLIPKLWKEWKENGWVNPMTTSYALTKTGRFRLNSLLINLSEYLDEINEDQVIVQWPELF